MFIQVEINAKRSDYSVRSIAKETYFFKKCGNKLFIDEVIQYVNRISNKSQGHTFYVH